MIEFYKLNDWRPKKLEPLCSIKKKVAYVKVDNIRNLSDSMYLYVEENEVNVENLKLVPTYTCKFLKPLNRKNLIEPKNEKFTAKTCTFDVTKCDKIFDLLVVDG